MAMVMVTGIMAVLMIFLLTGLTYVLNNVPASRRDQDAKAAYAAAEAGLEEYIARLNANSNYWQMGNTDASNPA
jgi:Tfp pilus assembly protein PilX